MSKRKEFAQWRVIALAAAVMLGLLVVTHGMTATAAPPQAPVAGITVTPTPTNTPDPPEWTDLVILKSADPTECRPGDEVTWTLNAVNIGNIAAVDVVVTDDMPVYLEILDVTTSQGTAGYVGQRITVEVGTMGPDFEVEIVIETRVREDTPAPLTIENVAVLACPNCHDRWARAEIDILGPPLPPTGGLGTWWMVAACLGTGLVVLSLALSNRQTR